MNYLSSVGYFVHETFFSGAVTIGGSCIIPGAKSPNSGQPLLQLACIQESTLRILYPTWELQYLHFLYSWKCGIYEGDFSYVYRNGSIEVIEYNSGNGYPDFPYENYPDEFRAVHMGLEEIKAGDQEIIANLNDPNCSPDYKFSSQRAEELSIPAHQFGGEPYLISPRLTKKCCVICDVAMPLAAAISNKSYSTPEGFFGNDFVQLIYFVCAKCKVISVLNVSE